jgi:hypothetical protein
MQVVHFTRAHLLLRITFLEDKDLMSNLFQGKHRLFWGRACLHGPTFLDG